MNSKHESFILQIIKYTPPLFIITMSILISFSLYINNKKIFNKEKKLIEIEHIESNKELIKNQVNSIYKYIIKQQKNTENKLKENLKEKVYSAHKIAMNIYEENKHLDKKIVQKMIKDAIRTIRFNNGRGYFFIYSFDYECILLPINKKIEGKNFYNFKEGKGEYLTRNIIKVVKEKKEDYMRWWYHKPSDMNNQYEKLGFNKHFEPYDWFIGTGEYIDDFENDIKKDVLEHIQNFTYSKNGYIFVLNYEGYFLSHIRKDIIGLNIYKTKETKNNKEFHKSIEIAKNKKDAFGTYSQVKNSTVDLPEKKTSYLKGIKNWEWIIGKGFYENEINKIVLEKKAILDTRLKEDLNNLIISTLVLTSILLFISIYISKLLERRFKDYQDEIKTNLLELTKQQNILSQQSKMAAIGEMIANIGHQWRQPLSIISTSATGLKIKKEFGELSDEEFNEGLEYINNSTQYLSRTIDDFRNFFSNDKEKIIFSLEDAFENAINIIGIQYKNKNITIEKDIQHIKTIGIKSQLTQVFINILNNSRDELIKDEALNRIIHIHIYKDKNTIYIKIKDNAGGVPKEILEHVFDPYFTTKSKDKGTGIGLYMSKEIIEKQFNGNIYMENCKYKYKDTTYEGALTIIKLPQKEE